MATTRARLAIKNLGKSRTEEEALVRANYSPSYARSGQIKKTKGWEELMEKHLPDKLLTKVHLDGLEANKVISANITYGEADEKTNDFIEVPDHPTRHKFLDSAYKIKGKYPKEKTDVTNQINIIGGVEIHVRKDS